MSNGCPNCEALCTICQDNTYNWHELLCNSCRLAVAHTEERIIKLLMDRAFWLVHLDRLAEAEELKLQVALIKGEK